MADERNLLTIGIQGGEGSFNHEAALDYTQRHGIENFALAYLYTSERVLQAVDSGEVDLGQFAVHNSLGGIVEESLHAMAGHVFEIVEQFGIVIRHCLMKRKDVSLDEITAVMAHPQVFKQCTKNFSVRFPRLRQMSGEGELIDHAKVAQELAAGRLPKTLAVAGSKTLAYLYDLEVVAEDLQDSDNNVTSFLVVRQRH